MDVLKGVFPAVDDVILMEVLSSYPSVNDAAVALVGMGFNTKPSQMAPFHSLSSQNPTPTPTPSSSSIIPSFAPPVIPSFASSVLPSLNTSIPASPCPSPSSSSSLSNPTPRYLPFDSLNYLPTPSSLAASQSLSSSSLSLSSSPTAVTPIGPSKLPSPPTPSKPIPIPQISTSQIGSSNSKTEISNSAYNDMYAAIDDIPKPPVPPTSCSSGKDWTSTFPTESKSSNPSNSSNLSNSSTALANSRSFLPSKPDVHYYKTESREFIKHVGEKIKKNCKKTMVELKDRVYSDKPMEYSLERTIYKDNAWDMTYAEVLADIRTEQLAINESRKSLMAEMNEFEQRKKTFEDELVSKFKVQQEQIATLLEAMKLKQ